MLRRFSPFKRRKKVMPVAPPETKTDKPIIQAKVEPGGTDLSVYGAEDAIRKHKEKLREAAGM